MASETSDGRPAHENVSGMVYLGSGYGNFGGGSPNNKLYAFGL